jgi:hypothetical protein
VCWVSWLIILPTIGGKDEEEDGRLQNKGRKTRNNTKMNYMEIKQLIEKGKILNKKGKLTDKEIQALVNEFHNHRAAEEVNNKTVEREIR